MLRILKKILGYIIIFLIIIGFFHMLNTDLFKIVDVNIQGDYALIEKDIVDKLEILKGKNIYSININDIEKEILKDARVNDIKIRRLLPKTINIEINEKKGVAIARFDSSFYIVDKNMNVYGYLNEIDNVLPIINITEDVNVADYKIIFDKILMNKRLYNKLSELRYNDEYYILLLDDGTKIYTDTDVVADKYISAMNVYEKEGKENNKLEYIDLRFKDINVK